MEAPAEHHAEQPPSTRLSTRRVDGNVLMLPTSQTPQTPSEEERGKRRPARWNMGMLSVPETDEVPGSVLLLSRVSEFNESLGMQHTPARTSTSSFPYSPGRRPSRSSSPFPRLRAPPKPGKEKKRTADGQFVLDPQPDDSPNDPLNWSVWRRDAALLSLGFYCMLGGGITPILAAGFKDVAAQYDVSVPRVALTTGLHMLGLGLGSVVLSPTAILYGKRPVYLIAALCFIISAIWCALSPSFVSLVCARIFQGFAVSSVECLPSATVAEIYFLHEKAYRLGIYTLLLLGGKNLVPLVSAAIIQSLGWRWVFWILAIFVGLGVFLLFVFVPETFWDRSPVPPKPKSRNHSTFRSRSHPATPVLERTIRPDSEVAPARTEDVTHEEKHVETRHAHFETDAKAASSPDEKSSTPQTAPPKSPVPHQQEPSRKVSINDAQDYFNHRPIPSPRFRASTPMSYSTTWEDPRNSYTRHHSAAPPKTWLQQLRPFSGRLSHDRWFKVALRPFVLYAYPSILWSSLVYALSIGWLIVLSESVSVIYISRDTYNFTPLQAGLVYISPFVGSVLGTAVAGKLSDLVVRYLARRNGGVYEPEFRLVMVIPIAFFTTIGLMGYGWSAQERDLWIVPTLFFGFISFGCSLGSTTAITFAVDSYRQYAGEALVTLNFSKNILHGLVWSLFFNDWLEADGSKDVFIAIGGIQLACLFTTIPMYIYGKRARMWTVRKNLMEKF